MSDCWTEETWRQIQERALPAVQTTGQWRGEGMLRHRTSPDTIDVEINLFSVKHPYSPDQLCLAMVQRDITERKKVERLKSEFVSTVSHELRTPVTSITGALGLMAGGVAGQFSDQARKLVEIAYRNSERLVRLVNDILDIDKIESNRMCLDLRPVDVEPLVQQVVEANRTFAAQYQVELVAEGGLAAAKIYVDVDRLVQVLTNLVSNAAKFSPPHASVVIATLVREGSVRIAVTDHGPGIPEEFHSRIFAKFSQADASDARRKGGTGLGLSIAKALTERLGGRIGFDSTRGRGTTFYVEFPEWQEDRGSCS